MTTELQIDSKKIEKILMRIEKPGRYVGGEYNQVIKSWDSVLFKICLIFPDIYELGLPNLGLQILYDLINKRVDSLAERSYAPAQDMESALRDNRIPLFSLETRHALGKFDLIGFTLPYETLYTNVLNILDLSYIPLYASQRNQTYPIVISGGHAVTNPEPMAPFFDAIVIGEGEEVILEIIDSLKDSKTLGFSKIDVLKSLSHVNGVYVPEFYKPHYLSDGRVSHIEILNKVPNRILKRIVAKLPPPPEKPLVPLINIVHNRIAIEIMRGCTRGCRFCHAGFSTRPIRERPVKEIVDSIDVALKNTGYEEVALLSLSSSDYTHIEELVSILSKNFSGRNIVISLPSLRIETLSINLLETLSGSRRSGFTLAPEAATEKLRNTINKPIPDQSLLDIVKEIYSRGWQTIKLYFMIGHPSETLDDVEAIIKLCNKVLAIGKKELGGRASLHLGVGTFVPKPHTTFQWTSMDILESIETKLQLLRSNLRKPGIKLTWTDPQTTLLEAWLSRGDRRIADVIFRAWKDGAKFDAWKEHFKFSVWEKSFSEAGLDPFFYSHRNRLFDEVFPWDLINLGVEKSYLLKDYEWSLDRKARQDCREICYGCGILTAFSQIRQNSSDSKWMCPEINPPDEFVTKEVTNV